MEYAIRAEGLCKSYPAPGGPLPVLKGVSLAVPCGGFAAITGPSGCGKSTLLALLGCLDSADAGSLQLMGRQVCGAKERTLCAVRANVLGFVFQSYNLVASLTAAQNVELALRYRGIAAARRPALARKALEQLGLGDRADHLPAALSGGQAQRVAVARALACRPPLLLADEPTGNLDPESAAAVLAAMQNLRAAGTAVVLITHDAKLAALAPDHWRLDGGVLVQA